MLAELEEATLMLSVSVVAITVAGKTDEEDATWGKPGVVLEPEA